MPRPFALPATLLSLACLGTLTACPAHLVHISKQEYANLSAGEIGCPADELKISGEQQSFGFGDRMMPPWTAECRGHRFICSNAGKTVSCAEELAPAAAPAPVNAQSTRQ